MHTHSYVGYCCGKMCCKLYCNGVRFSLFKMYHLIVALFHDPNKHTFLRNSSIGKWLGSKTLNEDIIYAYKFVKNDESFISMKFFHTLEVL